MYKTVKITVDRPKGSCHPRYPDLYYPVNYGYVDGVTAPDGEEQQLPIIAHLYVAHSKIICMQLQG